MSAVEERSLVECPQCRGNGEEGYEPQGWWHGSGVHVVTWTCPVCKGDGNLTAAEFATLPEYCKVTNRHGMECGYSRGCEDCS